MRRRSLGHAFTFIDAWAQIFVRPVMLYPCAATSAAGVGGLPEADRRRIFPAAAASAFVRFEVFRAGHAVRYSGRGAPATDLESPGLTACRSETGLEGPKIAK